MIRFGSQVRRNTAGPTNESRRFVLFSLMVLLHVVTRLGLPRVIRGRQVTTGAPKREAKRSAVLGYLGHTCASYTRCQSRVTRVT